ncbi:MAG: hypothetical protein ACQETM_06790, partial [Bacteroidota bacterium]
MIPNKPLLRSRAILHTAKCRLQSGKLVAVFSLVAVLWILMFVAGTAACDRTVTSDKETWQPDEHQAAFLDQLQEDTFRFFHETANPLNGLVPDRYPDPPFASIAAVGFGLSSWIIGVERGYITREEAAELTRNTIRFFWEAPQGPEPEGNAGHKGFFYHFLDMETGTRYRTNELSTIDSALLLAGMLSSQQYFDGDNPVEREIRALTNSIYTRMDWRWMFSVTDPPLISMGWHPES